MTYDWLQEGMSWFVTEPSQKSSRAKRLVTPLLKIRPPFLQGMMTRAETHTVFKHSFQLQVLFAGDNFSCEPPTAPLNWQNEDRQQTPVCIGIPIITEYEKYSANFGGFSSLWGRTNVPRHSLRSPVTTITFVT